MRACVLLCEIACDQEVLPALHIGQVCTAANPVTQVVYCLNTTAFQHGVYTAADDTTEGAEDGQVALPSLRKEGRALMHALSASGSIACGSQAASPADLRRLQSTPRVACRGDEACAART